MSETDDEKQEVNDAEEEKNESEADLICAPIQIIIPVVSEEEEEEEEVVEVKKKKKKKKGPSRAQKINALKSTLFQALRLVNEAKVTVLSNMYLITSLKKSWIFENLIFRKYCFQRKHFRNLPSFTDERTST